MVDIDGDKLLKVKKAQKALDEMLAQSESHITNIEIKLKERKKMK